MLPPLRDPGTVLGTLLPEVAAAVGLSTDVPVVLVGSHDTASAVVAVPAADEAFAYVSSGTWSLVGLELPAPVLTEQARAADFTNEAGVDGTTRFLQNVSGLWVLSECLRTWSLEGRPVELASLLAAAEEHPSVGTFEIGDHRLLAPTTCRPGSWRWPPSPGSSWATTRWRSRGRCSTASLRRTPGAWGWPPAWPTSTPSSSTSSAAGRPTTCSAAHRPGLRPAGRGRAAGGRGAGQRARPGAALGVDLPTLAAMRRLVRSTQPLRRFEP